MKIANADGSIAYEYDDSNRIYIDHMAGTSRPYTAEENLAADARQAQQVVSTNRQSLLDGLEHVINRALGYQATAQAIIDTPNADIRNNPVPHILQLARAQKRSAGDIIRLARLAGEMFDSADTGDSD